MDVLSDVIKAMRPAQPWSMLIDARAPWGLSFNQHRGSAFHFVLQGMSWLVHPNQEPIALSPGDVILVTQGTSHVIADDPSTPPVGSCPNLLKQPGGTGPRSLILSGVYPLYGERPNALLRGLPEIIYIPANPGKNRSLHSIVSLLGQEVDYNQPGTSTIVPALIDALLAFILRAWLAQQNPEKGIAVPGLSALSDQPIASALHAMHDDVCRNWTVEELADKVDLSRAVFARRFTAAVGEPPLTYLFRWRMTVAAGLLRETSISINGIAAQVGYSSEFAFAKAFKREYQVAPGQYRNSAEKTPEEALAS
jgi:AraC-like DNA-binding protein